MSEHTEQAAFIQWCEMQKNVYPELAWVYAVPNGGQRHKAVAGKMKAEGQKPGVPDLCLPIPKAKPDGGIYCGLYQETKVKPNKPTPEQNKWLEFLACQSYAVAVCYGFDDLKAVMLWYLSLPPLRLPLHPPTSLE